MPALPVDEHVPALLELLRRRRAAVVVAPPGAGKTTRLPPAFTALGPTLLLQPRRVAARALARRIAYERGWTLGEEVGWQVRFEQRYSPRTRLLVATEGILTARLQADPLLSDFAVIVLDEFHERSLHADLALALARQALLARDDLVLVVMSATLEAEPLAAFLGGCPVVEIPARTYPVGIEHWPGVTPAEAVRRHCARAGSHGDVLVFLPGMAEIRRAETELAGGVEADVCVLHGSLSADAQDAALVPGPRRKVILATNVAETSLTVEGVLCVIDAGQERVLRYDPDKGLERLETERISRGSATQRAGRAGRTAPGVCVRLWDERERLQPAREPEIARADLCAPFLDVLAWGGDPRRFEWFEAPSAAASTAALTLLTRLGALDADGRLSSLGARLQRLPVHPRLARVLLAAGGGARAAALCALLSERMPAASAAPTTTSCDLFPRIDRLAHEAPGTWRVARELEHLLRRTHAVAGADVLAGDGDDRLRRALLLGYPDRVARRRASGAARLLLANGSGAVLARESGVTGGEFLLALDVQFGARGPGSEALVRLASIVEPEWLAPTRRDAEHVFDADAGVVRAREREWYEALLLREHPRSPEPAASAPLLLAELQRRGLDDASESLRRRLKFAGLAADLEGLLEQAVRAHAEAGGRDLPTLDLGSLLPHALTRRLAELAPEAILVPSGRRARLEYRADGSVVAAVKLQELFGLADSPRLGAHREALTFELLAPNGRPVQTTRDLRSFWERTYADVRKELRGRYPRHPWPEDPWNAPPTARAKPRA
jgi:ATP-dependent helicase HrpB